MGILDQAPDPPKLCRFGKIITAEIGTPDGETLEPDDVEYLTAMRARIGARGTKHGPAWFASTLRSAGITCSTSVIQLHLGGGCGCPPGTPLKDS